MEGGRPTARAGPLVVGVVAVVLGGVLIGASGADGPARPRVLGPAAPATTTTALPYVDPAPTTAPPPGIPPSQSRFSAPAAPETEIGTEEPPRTAPAAAPAAATTTTTRPVTTPPTTREKCPSGAPVAAMRSWDGSTDGDGTWHLTVTGIVSNRTGAPTDVDTVTLVFTRADGSTYEAPQRPRPAPRTIADGAEATWRFEGSVPPGAEPVDVTVAVDTWRWTATPAHCG